MQRFSFSSHPLWKDISIEDESFVHQIAHVLRSRPGDEIVLFNGNGYDYRYAIKNIAKKSIELTYVQKQENGGDSSMKIRLYQALPNKYEKIEYILQKWVEVGIQEFIFFRADRSQKLVINEKKILRFQEIIREAVEQCGGDTIPSLLCIEQWAPLPADGTSYFLHTKDTKSIMLDAHIPDSHSYNIFVGPEGGWSDQEAFVFEERGIRNLSLGKRILRTETASSVVAFFLLHK